ncbi:DUF433 domain-containing protein [candidate division KSB1 bacterium]|nr:DUF433 domain-containing protein [candidate division KSB1 bacterium]
MKLSTKKRVVSPSTAQRFKKGGSSRIVKNGQVIELGNYVVSDPNICHGYLTFKGTRIMVGPVLAALAEGRSKREILRSWPRLTWEAVQEAQMLAVHRLIFDFPEGKRLWLNYIEDAIAETYKKYENRRGAPLESSTRS